MKYDFETMTDRKNQGSSKYINAFRQYPDLEKNVIPLSVADMEFKNPPELVEGLKKYLDETVLGYTIANNSYYDALELWMHRIHDFDIKREWVVNNSGVVPAIFSAVRCLTNPGDGVILFSPVYYPFYNAIKAQNRVVADAPLIKNGEDFFIDFEKFEELAKKPENKVLLFCSPHNPVSRVWKRQELEKLEKIILENDLYLISDEIHSDIILPGIKHTVFQTLSDELAEKAITFTSASKTFNLAGMGVCATVIKNDEIREKFRTATNMLLTGANSALGFKATEICYNECEEWLNQFIDKIVENIAAVREELKDTKVKIVNTTGTYLLLLDFHEYDMDDETREKLLAGSGVITDPGRIFGETGSGYERINLAAPTAVIRDACRRIKENFK